MPTIDKFSGVQFTHLWVGEDPHEIPEGEQPKLLCHPDGPGPLVLALEGAPLRIDSTHGLHLGETPFLRMAGDQVGLQAPGGLSIQTGSPPSPALTISSDGSVGIGKTAHIGQLEVQGGVKAQELELNGDLRLGGARLGSSSTNRLELRAAGDIHFFTGAGAAERLTVLANGNVGVGTPSPVTSLEVAGNWTGEEGALRLTGDKPSIRFTGGEVAGKESWLLHLGSDNHGSLQFFRRTGDQAWTNVLTMSPSGNVGIGTAEPARCLHIATPGNDVLMLQSLPGGRGNEVRLDFQTYATFKERFPTARLCAIDNGVFTSDLVFLTKISGNSTNGLAERLRIRSGDGAVVATGPVFASNFPGPSDIRLKDDLRPLTNVLARLERIRGVSFQWRRTDQSAQSAVSRREIGVVAQEVEAVFPELVIASGEEEYKSVDYGRLTAVLIEAVKQLKQVTDALAGRLEALASQVEALERRWA